MPDILDVFREAADGEDRVQIRYYVADEDGLEQPYLETGDGSEVFHDYFQQAVEHRNQLEEKTGDRYHVHAVLDGTVESLDEFEPEGFGGEPM